MYRIIASKKSGEITLSLPPSKSLTHRLLILGALNRGQTVIENRLRAEDTEITYRGLKALGMHAREEDHRLICEQPLGKVAQADIYLGNSGSSARFLVPLASYGDRPVRLHGTARLHRRPFAELFQALQALGGRFEAPQQTLPATIHPAELQGGRLTFDHLPSSQIITGLMLAGLWMHRDLILELRERVPSLPYVAMTARLMQRLGLSVELSPSRIEVAAARPEMHWQMTVEPDLSAASYWVAVALIGGIRVTLPGVILPSLQGDERIFGLAEAMGGQVMVYTDRVEITGDIRRGITADCGDIPDLVPTLSVMALFAPEPSRLMNVAHLQFKESDRIAAIRQNIHTLGGRTEFDG
ncbi:MAG: 3-phosphoshikimate 1-carboxyvinyltransferase, partial [Calditrichaeota bacterium]